MVSKEEKNRIDAQWQLLQPGWGPKDNQGERKMLYDALEEGENIERLSGGGWKVLDGRNEMESHQRGVVLATDRCVIFLNKGRLSKNVRRISYHHIETVEETGTDGVRITGPGFFASSGTYEARLPAGMTASFACPWRRVFGRSSQLGHEAAPPLCRIVLLSSILSEAAPVFPVLSGNPVGIMVSVTLPGAVC